MGAGAERLTGIDHQLEHVGAPVRCLPRRSHVQRRRRRDLPPLPAWRHQHGPVELLPAFLPVVGDLAGGDLDDRLAHDRVEIGQARQLARGAVDRVLDRVRAGLSLFDPGRTEAEQLRQHHLRLLAADADGEPDHAAWLPSARLSFAKTDSWERRFSSLRLSLSRSASSRCSAFRRRGMTTLTTARRSPRRPRRSEGMPSRRSVSTSPGWVPAGSSMLAEPSSVGTSRVAPSAANGAATSSTVIRSSPSRTKRGSSRTRTSTYRSPGGAPASPAWPLPASRMRCPSAIPAGTSTWSSRARASRPRPPHSLQGLLAIRPSPWQTSHGIVRTIWPNGVEVTA